jgi:ABC-type Zn uptake system ZnuABC Zn-binding protein ZnuA
MEYCYIRGVSQMNYTRISHLSVTVFLLGACSTSKSTTEKSVTSRSSGDSVTTEIKAVTPDTGRVKISTAGDWYSCADARPFTLTALTGRRLQVATTVAPITSIVSNVAGDAADVIGIVPEGTNSHTYEPKPSVAKQLSTADLVFVNGLKLEEPTQDLAKANLQKDAAIVTLGDRTIKPSEQIYDFSFPKEGGKPNPHLWTNPPMAACYASNAAQAMATMDPANAVTYATNADLYIGKLEALDKAFQAASDSVPAGNRKLLTYHDAYAYFAKHYGWEVIGAIQVSSFEEPTPKEVANLITQVKQTKVPAIFGSEVFPSTVLEQIGREAGIKYVDVLRDDDLPGAPGDPDHSFLGLMRFDYVTMVEALGGSATALKNLDVTDIGPDKATYPQ